MQIGSKSFSAASRLLPPRVRRPATIVYAFCRISDDAVDSAADPAQGLAAMQQRLNAVYAEAPFDEAVDRALSFVVRHYGLPRVLFEGLLEGYRWDVEGRHYDDAAAVQQYCVRVAGTVGAIMAVLMGATDATTVARACDLGVAMQLTNICRDVGEDARAGRIYLPMAWLREANIDVDAWLAAPTFQPGIAMAVERLLTIADGLYTRAQLGVVRLPRDCRASIRAASLIYADIGRVVRQNEHDSVSSRAITSKRRKLLLLLRACGAILWRSRASHDPALPEAQYLVDAVSCSSGHLT
ncbi:MAG: phytoene/squalene synthase family protein [Clostridia bacterium]|nr:phytoene/squalene synthase family protein [Deltaproteobacteria bacterium]